MLKKSFFLALALLMALSFSSITAFANGEVADPPEEELLPEGPLLSERPGSDFGTNTIGRTIKYSKENVRISYEWSSYRRVSDNMYGPGTITADRETTYNTTVSGSYGSLGIDTSKSVSSKIGYTLNAGKNSRVYMGYRVRYKVEKGERVGKIGSRVISRNSYTVKYPQYGEYKLINY